MSSDSRDKRLTQIGIAVMLVLLAILGVRSTRTVQAVLAPVSGTAAAAPAASQADPDIASLSRRDSLIDSAAPGRRDPFRESADPLPRVRRSGVSSDEETPRAKPGLCALLFDNVNPTTQVSIDGVRSGWLRQGDEFQGWTVAVITKDSVTMTKGGDSLVLP
jgi:hypothetical protein